MTIICSFKTGTLIFDRRNTYPADFLRSTTVLACTFPGELLPYIFPRKLQIQERKFMRRMQQEEEVEFVILFGKEIYNATRNNGVISQRTDNACRR